jgi:hypothetical protein
VQVTKCPGGDPNPAWVTAAAAGVVVASGKARVEIAHEPGKAGLRTGYYHLSGIPDDIKVGRCVRAGQRLGHPSCEAPVGTTYGVHLHFYFKRGDEVVKADGHVLSGWTIIEDGLYKGRMVKNGDKSTTRTSYAGRCAPAGVRCGGGSQWRVGKCSTVRNDLCSDNRPAGTCVAIVGGPVVDTLKPTSATITWNTDQDATSRLTYGTATLSSERAPSGRRRSHRIELAGLRPNTKHRYVVESWGATGGARSAEHVFTTPDLRTIPPVITAGPGVKALKPVSAKITWRTDQPTTHQVAYGRSTSYDRKQPPAPSTAFETDHVVLLPGLIPGKTYYFKATSWNGAGLVVSKTGSFRTPACPSGTKYCSGACVQLGTMENCTACGERCDDGNPCTLDACSAGVGCTHLPLNGDACTVDGVDGTCVAGQCVTTCVQGEACTGDADCCAGEFCVRATCRGDVGKIVVHVIDENQAPAPGACVSLYLAAGPSANDFGDGVVGNVCDFHEDANDGTITLGAFPAGTYIIGNSASPPGHAPAVPQLVNVAAGQVAEVSRQYLLGGEIEVYLYDEQGEPYPRSCIVNYAPLSGATDVYYSQGGTNPENGALAAWLDYVTPGDYRVSVVLNGPDAPLLGEQQATVHDLQTTKVIFNLPNVPLD